MGSSRAFLILPTTSSPPRQRAPSASRKSRALELGWGVDARVGNARRARRRAHPRSGAPRGATRGNSPKKFSSNSSFRGKSVFAFFRIPGGTHRHSSTATTTPRPGKGRGQSSTIRRSIGHRSTPINALVANVDGAPAVYRVAKTFWSPARRTRTSPRAVKKNATVSPDANAGFEVQPTFRCMRDVRNPTPRTPRLCVRRRVSRTRDGNSSPVAGSQRRRSLGAQDTVQAGDVCPDAGRDDEAEGRPPPRRPPR